MNLIARLVGRISKGARRQRAAVFTRHFELDRSTRILDLGGGNGAQLHAVLRGTRVRRCNVYIADIDARAVAVAHSRYGFTPVHIDGRGPLPFPVGFFDIVYCSSVIEHLTVPSDLVWRVRRDCEFRARANERQRQFAREVERLGRAYFVQTPHRHFPVESHSWLPFVGHLPRHLQVPLLRFTNAIWVKQTNPDWHLLTHEELAQLFPSATIVEERMFGLPKSLMAIKSGVRSPARTYNPRSIPA